jgi:hypothetical protein
MKKYPLVLITLFIIRCLNELGFFDKIQCVWKDDKNSSSKVFYIWKEITYENLILLNSAPI